MARKGVTATLTARERRVARWFAREGFERPYLTVAAAKKADVSYATAAAHLAMETGNGKNIFGCDHGPGVAFCHEPVTKAKVQALLRSSRANGVGPLQLTFKPFVQEADDLGGAHRPYFNMLVGFRILKRNWEANGHNLRTAYRLYNGSGPAAERYADTAIRKRQEYVRKLERFLHDEASPTEKRVRQVQEDLLWLGFAQVGKVDGVAGPATRDAVRQFKRMCVLHRFRRVDGSIGVETARIVFEHRVHLGKVSAHFTFREFASKSSASCPGNGHIEGNRDLIVGLERLRAHPKRNGRLLGIRNGYRDDGKNRCVGGKRLSQHLYGNAVDLIGCGLTVVEVRSLRCFSGIGFVQATGEVVHVDVRHTDPAHNVTRSTVANAAVWAYA